ncbi:MAG: hypothetical protein H7X77_08700 [Anaerolineae bacterium]|nr:hypothetical protein [Anaerolineae bacterium]
MLELEINLDFTQELVQRALMLMAALPAMDQHRFKVYDLQTFYYSLQHQIDESLAVCEQAAALAEQINDQPHLARYLRSIGLNAMYKEDYPTAIRYASRSMELFKTLGDEVGYAGALSNLALVNWFQDERELAVERMLAGLEIQERHGAGSAMIINLYNLGIWAEWSNDPSTAIRYYERGYEVSLTSGVYHMSILHNSGAAKMMQLLGDYEGAYQRFTETIQLAHRWTTESGMIATALLERGKALIARGDLDAAEQDMMEGMAMAHQMQTTFYQLDALILNAHLLWLRGAAEASTELIGLVLQHPDLPMEIRNRHVLPLQAQLEAKLSPESFAAALERGKTWDLATVIQAKLAAWQGRA